MTINLTEISKATKKGLDINEYIYLLCSLDGCTYLFNNDYFKDTIINLRLKGYLQGDTVTKAGKDLIKEISGDIVSNKIDSNFYQNLHKKLQNELISLTGKKQKVIGGKYSFLCNAYDLEHRLSKVVKKYKLEDLNKVEKLLLKYIHTCYKADFKMTQLLEYYIQKLDTSKLATDYFNDNKEEVIIKQETKLIDTKDLF